MIGYSNSESALATDGTRMKKRVAGSKGKRLPYSYRLPATGYPLPATGYPLPATGYPLPATRYPLPATCYLLGEGVEGHPARSARSRQIGLSLDWPSGVR
jgi:hypothetical protein